MMAQILTPQNARSVLSDQTHRFIRGIFLLLSLPGICFCGDANKTSIYIAGLFPVSEGIAEGAMGRGVLPAVELALSHVNSHPGLLEDYHLEITWNDTQCDMAVGTKLFFDMMHNGPDKVMLFGGLCSHVTGPIAESSIWWNITQLSYGDTNPVLSDREIYSNFFRTVPSDSDFNPARVLMLKHFNWTRVGTLFQDASKGSSRYAYAHNKLINLLEEAGIDIVQFESFADDPKPALTNLKQKDIRIIIGNFDAAMARRVFCSAHEQKLYGPKYVWMILGDYDDAWWRANDSSVFCTREELMTVLEGYIATDVLPLSTLNVRTVSNLTSMAYLRKYNSIRKAEFSKYHGYAYDGIWVIAKAIDVIIKENPLKEFALADFREARIRSSLNDTDFIGVTGPVRFSNGDRVGQIVIQQFQSGRMATIGEYHAINDKLLLDKEPIVWQGRGPPRDRTLREWQMQRVNFTIYCILSTISGLGVVLACIFLAVNIRFRNHRYIKMSSPNMNNIIIIGCIVCYASVFLLGADGGPGWNVCQARAWTMAVGFTFAFGAMFSKTWRVHAIFTNIKLNRRVIKDYKLILIVLVLLKIDAVILATWQIIDPVKTRTKELQPEADPFGGDVEIIPVIEYCASDHTTIFLGVIYAYKGLLLIFGCFLAWETRQVSIPALNDSKYIGLSVYNVVIMCVSGAAISFVIKDRQDAAYLIIGLFIIFCTTITLCLVFLPKLIELKRDPKGDEKRVRATLKKSVKREGGSSEHHQKTKALVEENLRYKQILDSKNNEIEELLCLLGDDDHAPEGVTLTPVHRVVLALRNDNNVHFASRLSQGTLFSEDDGFMYSSSSSATNIWPIEPTTRIFTAHTRNPNINTQETDVIEMREISPARQSCDDKLSNAVNVKRREDYTANDPFLPKPLSERDRDVTRHSLNRPSSSCAADATTPRTPSYQGLKYISDIYLKETDILSDYERDRSDPSETASVRSGATLPEHEDESDPTTSLLA